MQPIADNCATHKHPTVKAWLACHSRFHMHLTPPSASCSPLATPACFAGRGPWRAPLNQVERFFASITDKRIRSGVFKASTN